MDIRPLDDKVAVSPQIALEDVGELAKKGYRTLICNRPDGEDAGQPPFEAVAQAASALGLETVFLPVTSYTIGVEPARAFAEAVAKSDGPVLAYCRSGTRCTMLWTIAGVLAGEPREQLRAAAATAGYDMSQFLDSFSA